MKKLERIKTIQLIVYIVLLVLCFALVVFNHDVYHAITESSSLITVTVLLWISVAASFFFMFLDFTYYAKLEKDASALKTNVHADPNADIANRLSCDEMIEKYLDQPLPENFGCIMFALTNIQDINKQYGHAAGNQVIKHFSGILKLASTEHCFVGRNGGNQFLALFENGSEESIKEFLARVREETETHNAMENTYPIQYTSGIAFHESDPEVSDITSLIALAGRRAQETHQ